MPRFVLLDHDHPTRHWDLMLEVGPVLWTWRLDAIPDRCASCQATRIADHRPIYLDYEGPISRDRGEVRRVASAAAGGDRSGIRHNLISRPLAASSLFTSAIVSNPKWKIDAASAASAPPTVKAS